MKSWIAFLVCFQFVLMHHSARSQTRDSTCIIYFSTNQFTLDSANKEKLAYFTRSVTEVVDIVGNTDSIGSTNDNLKLSKLRAQSVYTFLLQLGARMVCKPRFAGELVLPNADLSESRRVEITGHPAATARLADDGLSHGDTVELSADNIYFLPDRAVIAPESVAYAESLGRSMIAYRNYDIEIIGHINYQGRLTSTSNGLVKLAEQRAKVLYELFAQCGVPKTSMRFKGVANTQPAISAPRTYEEKTRNMRVQILLIHGHR